MTLMLRMKGGLNRLNPFLSTSGVLVEHNNVLAGLKAFVSSKFGAHLCVGMSFRHIMGSVESSDTQMCQVNTFLHVP